MAKRRRTPQEKKRLSYARDHRSVYGNNDKAARRAVPRNKRRVNRAYRRTTRTAIDSAPLEHVDTRVAGVVRDGWQKGPDAPLGAVLRDKLAAREERAGRRATRRVR